MCRDHSDLVRTASRTAFNDPNRRSYSEGGPRGERRQCVLSSGDAFVPMMQSADLWDRDDRSHRNRVDRSVDWRVLAER